MIMIISIVCLSDVAFENDRMKCISLQRYVLTVKFYDY